jgi:hypothetical protein
MFDRFADIYSLKELIDCLPTTIKNDRSELTKLVAGNVVSCSFINCKKNYRVINASDFSGRLMEIDAKGAIIDKKISI